MNVGRRGDAATRRGESVAALVRRFPALASVPCAALGRFPTRADRAEALAPGLWIKREDLAAEPLGGNKVRALELLLGEVKPGDQVATVGAMGSTHALATAIYTKRLGARVSVFRWPQEMSADAVGVARRVAETADTVSSSWSIAAAFVRASIARLRGAHWIPAGGTSPLGVLGQVSAALELAEQIRQGELPVPDRIVLPLGTGGTVAGLWLGMAIAGLPTEIVGVRVTPRAVANRWHIRSLARRARRIIERASREAVVHPRDAALRLVHGYYGGAYGRVTPAGRAAVERALSLTGIRLDTTYSAKALAATLDIANAERGTTLFWLTFDGRWLSRSQPS